MTLTSEIKQELYEKQREYFSRDGAVLAKSYDGSCQYRLFQKPTEPACAVGCLISNEFYAKHFREDGAANGASVWELTGLDFWGELEVELFGERIKDNLDIVDLDELTTYLSATQELHDSQAASAHHLVQLLDDYADECGLEVVS